MTLVTVLVFSFIYFVVRTSANGTGRVRSTVDKGREGLKVGHVCGSSLWMTPCPLLLCLHSQDEPCWDRAGSNCSNFGHDADMVFMVLVFEIALQKWFLDIENCSSKFGILRMKTRRSNMLIVYLV